MNGHATLFGAEQPQQPGQPAPVEFGASHGSCVGSSERKCSVQATKLQAIRHNCLWKHCLTGGTPHRDIIFRWASASDAAIVRPAAWRAR